MVEFFIFCIIFFIFCIKKNIKRFQRRIRYILSNVRSNLKYLNGRKFQLWIIIENCNFFCNQKDLSAQRKSNAIQNVEAGKQCFHIKCEWLPVLLGAKWIKGFICWALGKIRITCDYAISLWVYLSHRIYIQSYWLENPFKCQFFF